MCRHLQSILFLVASSRLAFLIVTVTALCTPSLTSAQGVSATLDAKTSTSGSDGMKGNWMFPSGGYSLTAQGGAVIQLVSIKAEIQYLSGGVWTSFNPKLDQQATAGAPNWSAAGWIQIAGGYSYRVEVIMKYQYKLNPMDN